MLCQCVDAATTSSLIYSDEKGNILDIFMMHKHVFFHFPFTWLGKNGFFNWTDIFCRFVSFACLL